MFDVTYDIVKAIVRVECDHPACKNMCEIEGTLQQAGDQLKGMGWRLAFEDHPSRRGVRVWVTNICVCPHHATAALSESMSAKCVDVVGRMADEMWKV